MLFPPRVVLARQREWSLSCGCPQMLCPAARAGLEPPRRSAGRAWTGKGLCVASLPAPLASVRDGLRQQWPGPSLVRGARSCVPTADQPLGRENPPKLPPPPRVRGCAVPGCAGLPAGPGKERPERGLPLASSPLLRLVHRLISCGLRWKQPATSRDPQETSLSQEEMEAVGGRGGPRRAHSVLEEDLLLAEGLGTISHLL